MNTPTNNTHLFPPHFWEALITIHNHFFKSITTNPHHLKNWPLSDTKLQEAFLTMDCWLDFAIAAGLHMRKK